VTSKNNSGFLDKIDALNSLKTAVYIKPIKNFTKSIAIPIKCCTFAAQNQKESKR